MRQGGGGVVRDSWCRIRAGDSRIWVWTHCGVIGASPRFKSSLSLADQMLCSGDPRPGSQSAGVVNRRLVHATNSMGALPDGICLSPERLPCSAIQVACASLRSNKPLRYRSAIMLRRIGRD